MTTPTTSSTDITTNKNNRKTKTTTNIKTGPEPTLLTRKEVDALYETLEAIVAALDELRVDYILTGGSLLGAIRQHSILFCDDDIDVTILEYPRGHPRGHARDPMNNNRNGKNGECCPYSEESAYDRVRNHLQRLLGDRFTYSIRPWEAGDKVRPKFQSSVFVDIFTLRQYETLHDLRDVIGIKTNGQAQAEEYIVNITDKIIGCSSSSGNDDGVQLPLCPFWQFNTRKAIELWPKEIYRESELFPLTRDLKFGPLTGIQGPHMPVLVLERAFGIDCFDVYYPSASHKSTDTTKPNENGNSHNNTDNRTIKLKANGNNNASQSAPSSNLPPRTLAGGIWETSSKHPLQDEHYIPMQPTSRAKRRFTLHNRQHLHLYLQQQHELEELWQREEALRQNLAIRRPRRTVYMDGVFDMFHIGHLEAIIQCAALGDTVILGVVSDAAAKDYKRPPVIPQEQRVAIVQAMRHVDKVICPNPFVVTQEFMDEHDIDLVVHGFADAADEERQREFFEIPMQLGKFRTIRYYDGLSTTDIIARIQQTQQQETLSTTEIPSK